MNHMNTEQDTLCLPKPLTHTNTKGDIYRRQPDVDRQIREALGLYLEELRSRLEIKDKQSPEYLQEESLVYLIRHFHIEGNVQTVNELSECLLTRCAIFIDSRLRGLGPSCREDANAEVVAELFYRILDKDSDRGDFLQVRFWVAVKRLTIQIFRKCLHQANLESLAEGEIENIEVSTLKHEKRASSMLPTENVELMAIENEVIREALNRIEEPFRSAFLLRHYYMWPIEDQDPNVLTISQQFNKTPRTIRNWLAKAEECQAAWRGEQT